MHVLYTIDRQLFMCVYNIYSCLAGFHSRVHIFLQLLPFRLVRNTLALLIYERFISLFFPAVTASSRGGSSETRGISRFLGLPLNYRESRTSSSSSSTGSTGLSKTSAVKYFPGVIDGFIGLFVLVSILIIVDVTDVDVSELILVLNRAFIFDIRANKVIGANYARVNKWCESSNFACLESLCRRVI